MSGVPVLRSALFGRDEPVGTVAGLLAAGERLVTIAGPGGIGKSRVALEVGRRQDQHVVFVPLADADSATAVACVARAAAPGAALGADPFDTVAAALSQRPTVLILDTFEHLLDTAPTVGAILDRCPALQVLVTSRARLRLDGEQVVRLSALPSGAQGAAVEMFQARAAAVGGDIGDPDTVAKICAVVDGNPLAIELAAARTTVLSVSELSTRLPTDQLAVLARGNAEIARRHQSIRDTIAWSVVLLGPAAERLFRACAAFPGSFSIEAAEAIGGGDVLDALAELVDLHLVEPVDEVASRRYRMLDTIREYGRELLAAGPDAALVQDRMIEWSVDFADRAGQGLISADEPEWIIRVGLELPILTWAARALAEQGDAHRGVVLANRIGPFWTYRGPTSEGRRWFEMFLEDDRVTVPESLRLVATAWVCRLAIEQGEFDAIEPLERTRAAMAHHPDALVDWLQASEHLAYALTMHGDLERADELTAEAIEAARSAGEQFWLAVFLQRRAMSAQRHGQYELAAARAEESIEVARAIGYGRIAAWSGQLLASLAREPTDGADGRYEDLLASLAAQQAAGDRRGTVVVMALLGAVCPPGAYATAARWFRDGLKEAHLIGYWHGEVVCVAGVVSAGVGANRLNEAMDLHGSLGSYMVYIKAQLPPDVFARYQSMMTQVGAQLGRDAGVGVPSSEPAAVWSTVRDRALLLAADVLDEEPAPDVVVESPSLPPENAALSRRELEVLAQIARGHTNAQIARDLYLSPKTVMHHSTSIYRKMEVRGRAEAVATAFRTGLLRSSA